MYTYKKSLLADFNFKFGQQKLIASKNLRDFRKERETALKGVRYAKNLVYQI